MLSQRGWQDFKTIPCFSFAFTNISHHVFNDIVFVYNSPTDRAIVWSKFKYAKEQASVNTLWLLTREIFTHIHTHQANKHPFSPNSFIPN
jgi:hypothetical protein